MRENVYYEIVNIIEIESFRPILQLGFFITP